MKGSEKVKGKWPLKRGRPQDVGEKENVSPYKKFNVLEKGHGSQLEEKHNIGHGRGPLQYWICDKYHRKKGCPLY